MMMLVKLKFKLSILLLATVLLACNRSESENNFEAVNKTATTTESDPEKLIDSRLKAMYPRISKYTIESENESYETKFKIDGSELKSVFDGEGKWLRTEVDINFTHNINPKVLAAVDNSEFADWVLKEKDLIETPDSIIYKLEFKKDNVEWDIYYNEEGTVLNREKKTIDVRF